MMIRSFLQQLFTPPRGTDANFYRLLMFGCLLGLSFHLTFILLFMLLGVPPLALFNIVSVLFWTSAIVLVRLGKVITGYLAMTIEVIAHAIITVHFVGWAVGFQQYLIALVVTAFLVPRRPRVSAGVVVVATLTYIALYYYDLSRPATATAHTALGWFYIPNTIGALSVSIAPIAYYMAILNRAERALQLEHEEQDERQVE